MHAPLEQLTPGHGPQWNTARAFARKVVHALRRGASILKTALARLWIAMAPMRALAVRLTMQGEQPNRRMRPLAFWVFAAGVCGFIAASTAALGGFIMLGLDPLRGFSAPIGGITAANDPASLQLQASVTENLQRRAIVQGLLARAQALNRPQSETETLADALAVLDQLGQRQRDLANEKSGGPRSKNEISALSAQMETGARASVQRFSVMLAQGLRKQIQDDAARAVQLQADGWLGDLSSTISTLRLANEPLARLERQIPTARDPSQAGAIANRIADIGVAIARFRSPLPQAEDALQARNDFITLRNEILALVRQLQEQAEDRPWIFASSERKQSWREAVARLETLQPLLDDLASQERTARNSTRPEAIRAALLRATQIQHALEIGLTSALPEARVSSGPSSAVIDARKRSQRLAMAAEDAYREAFERTQQRFTESIRRRDRSRLNELRDEMKRLYDLTVRISAADKLAQATETESTALQAASEAASLSQAHQDALAQVNRLERALSP